MLRTTSYRTPGSPFAGEPDPWEARADTRRRAAPWHGPYGEERTSARDYARRTGRSLGADRRPYQRTEYGGLPNAATADDFRELARSIEQLRQRSAPPSNEPLRHSTTNAHTSSSRTATRAPSSGTPHRSSATARGSAAPYGATPRGASDARLGQVAREIASAADKSDVRRLERLLNEVLEKLDKLGHPPEPSRHHYHRDDEASTWRASTTTRRSDRRTDERDEEAPRRASTDRRGERRERGEDEERARTTERRRSADTARPSDFSQYEPAPPRGSSSRASKPRRLFT